MLIILILDHDKKRLSKGTAENSVVTTCGMKERGLTLTPTISYPIPKNTQH